MSDTPSQSSSTTDLRDKAATGFSRRQLVASFGLAGAAGTLAAFGAKALPARGFDVEAFDRLARETMCATPVSTHAHAQAGALPRERLAEKRSLKVAWNASAICLSGPLVGVEQRIFEKYNLDVELINFGGSTDQLLEAIATAKADAGVGMALRWLKPLEQGFDVKITAGTHGGCMRLLAPTASGIRSLSDLKGKTIAVADMTAPTKNLFAIQFHKLGIDAERDVEWRQFPGELLRAAVEKGEAHALADADPKTFLWLKDGKLTEISSNLHGEFAERTCCILGIRGSLIRQERAVARALTAATLEAQDYLVHHPEESARIFSRFAPPNSPIEDLTALVRYHTHGNHPVGNDLKAQLRLYAEELKAVAVFKPNTDPARFADRVYADVLS
ncbi:MAG: ABC transporter substrate-binding protein [Rhizobiales bacterium]|nr:ABC transporter substrate-binding protein [Hyphomicrobiales bacterium]